MINTLAGTVICFPSHRVVIDLDYRGASSHKQRPRSRRIGTMANDYKFEGWLGHDKSAAEGKMVWAEFEPKAWEETDVDIQVTHSGICGTDLHVLRSGWVFTSPLLDE